MLLYWGAKWCPPCNQLKATLFNRQDFIERSKAVVAVYVDGDGALRLPTGAAYRVLVLPELATMAVVKNAIERVKVVVADDHHQGHRVGKLLGNVLCIA